MFDALGILPEQTHRISRRQFERMVAAGVFDDDKIELLHGVLVTVSPQSASHAYVIRQLYERFPPLLGKRAIILVQMPLALTEDSEPEPDFCVVEPGNYASEHPRTSHLIVEVSLASIATDRGPKADLYAAANQPEYWLIDLQNRCALVHRKPLNGRYCEIQTHTGDEALAMQAFPDVRLSVSSLLPPL